MPDDSPPIGKRFSQVYIQRGEPTQDSERMRKRLAALIDTFGDLEDLRWDVPLKLGISVPNGWYELSTWKLRDVLDLITVAFWALVEKDKERRFPARDWDRWRRQVQLIFEEENVHYRVDEEGGVHFRFDAEFEHNRATTIAALQGARYRAALKAFEDGMAALAEAQPDGKTAIRNTFDAAESLFKLMFANSPRLTAGEAQKLDPLLQGTYATDKTALGAASKLLNAFKDWIDAAHFYRHAAGQAEPFQPPLTFAIQMVSVGASFIRWLAELDVLQQAGDGA